MNPVRNSTNNKISTKEKPVKISNGVKNCTAIILAAGMGKRLGEITRDIPKPLVEINNKTLIEYAIDFVKSVGIKEIIIVGGYHFDKLKKKVSSIDSSIKIINNTEYKHQNLLTLAKALAEVGENDILVCDADFVFQKTTALAVAGIMKDISIYCSYDLSDIDKDVMKVKVDLNGNMIKMLKQLDDFECIYTGIFFAESKYLPVLRKHISVLLNKHGKKTIKELLFQEFIKKGYVLRVVDIGKADWLEIDTQEDLEKAKKDY